MPRDARARFWSHVDTTAGPQGCWPWTASRSRFGYGFFRVGGRTVNAHRYALMMVCEPPTAASQALHRCANPPCVNPTHLYWGTAMDNHLDTVRDGHHVKPPRSGVLPPRHVGVDQHLAVLDPDKVRAIRAERAEGATYSQLAERWGISRATVAQVVTRKTWKEVS